MTSTHAKIDKNVKEDVTLLAIKGSHEKGHEIWSMGGYCGPGSGVFNPPAVTVRKMAQLTWHILSDEFSPGQQLLNTVNKCQSCLVPLPHFIDNIMTFSYHFSNCKKKENSIFLLETKIEIVLSVRWSGWVVCVCPFAAGYRQTYWSFNYDFLLVFPALLLLALSVGQTIVKWYFPLTTLCNEFLKRLSIDGPIGLSQVSIEKGDS